MKKFIVLIIFMSLVISSTYVITKAAFEDKGKLSSNTFLVGNIDIKLLNDLSKGISGDNLLDEKPGPVFYNINPSWVFDYPLKLYNAGSLPMQISSRSSYETINDPASLREYINVEIFEWKDENNNGLFESTEVGPVAIAKKTILKWKTEGINFGSFNASEIKGYIFRFTSEALPSTKQGQQASFDFEFLGN